uniref:Uncharacterized protein n=1 Tax=Panagrolaimus sp. JU765 TaxID=591449 RepID=A0AC34R7J2_9BILA
MMFIGGPYSKTLNQTRLEVLIAHSPDGTSLKNVYHWAQMFYAKKFQKFDYGKTQNVEFYGQEFPPKYNLSSIQTDTYLFFSDNDYLATPQDIQTNIFQTMGPKFLKYHENLKDYNHLDFMWSITATERIYSKIHHFIHENKNL